MGLFIGTGTTGHSPALKGSVFSNIDTLIAFQTSGEDAEYLYNELDQQVRAPDLTNLRPHECYLKTVDQDGNRLPVVQMETLAPPPGSPEAACRIQELMVRYTVPADRVKDELEAHMRHWHQGAHKLEESLKNMVNLDHLEDAYERFDKALNQRGSQGQDTMSKRPKPPAS